MLYLSMVQTIQKIGFQCGLSAFSAAIYFLTNEKTSYEGHCFDKIILIRTKELKTFRGNLEEIES